MVERSGLIRTFVARAGWGSADTAMLAGDASNRRYLRLTDPETGARAVLMDAPPDRGEDVRPFIRIDEFLAGLGFSVPRILARDTQAGLLLLEDLGDDLFARVLERSPEMENSLYSAATDLLAELHAHSPPPGLATYDSRLMTELSALAYDWYQHGGAGHQAPESSARFCQEFEPVLARLGPDAVLVQRDYHAENLIWLPGRTGTARVGLLDFQDAMAGHRAYDLVSLLQDARRDVHPATEETMLRRYVETTGLDDAGFRAAYYILGAQRNLRILGVFARLCLRDGKAHYVDMIPRVWALLERDLAHPALSGLRDLVLNDLPTPTPSFLQRLKDQCATVPDQS
ncbi:phosphotransferase [Roseovarius salis]|uniref:aminoglycoside phosphotransferase family protein n=1 Tax=Roseovarius salis TaxID=3376063 RepID=UPI0037C62375